jgi:hypothetical protein
VQQPSTQLNNISEIKVQIWEVGAVDARENHHAIASLILWTASLASELTM